MNDKVKIAVGLLLFLAAVTFPFWYTAARGGEKTRPELQLPAGESGCVESKEFMAAEHMQLLDEWRNAVVREGRTTYKSKTNGKTFTMSLTKTCLRCHESRAEFCDRCHAYADVRPYCWDCHTDAKGK